MDRFLLAENPMQDAEKRPLYLIHTIDPAMIIEIHHEHIAYGDGKMFLTANYNYEDTIETITLAVKSLLICDPTLTEDLKDKVEQVLKRAWRWYHSYLEWEDNNLDQIDNNEH